MRCASFRRKPVIILTGLFFRQLEEFLQLNNNILFGNTKGKLVLYQSPDSILPTGLPASFFTFAKSNLFAIIKYCLLSSR